MQSIPRRQSLVSQTFAILRDEIQRGSWEGWLPPERALCESLQVSRNTLRAALAQLRRDGIICSDHGLGNRILRPAVRSHHELRSRDVALLSPESLERLRPTLTLWIDELRALLNEQGCRLHIFYGPQFYRANPDAALERLLTQHSHGCWVLTLSNEATQRWFERKGVPCVVAGSVYAGVKLPFRDLDHRAICRHAAGTLLRLGHRRLALLMQKSRRAGDIESEEGFIESVRQSAHEDAEVVVATHDATVVGICRALRRLTEQKVPPTALMVANAYHYLTISTSLAHAGWRVPDDISIVSRDEDAFLTFMLPEPARYVARPQVMAKALLRAVIELLGGGGLSTLEGRIMPDFIPGGTLAGPASQEP